LIIDPIDELLRDGNWKTLPDFALLHPGYANIVPLYDYDVQIAKRDLRKTLDRIETVNKPEAA